MMEICCCPVFSVIEHVSPDSDFSLPDWVAETLVLPFMMVTMGSSKWIQP